MKKIIIIFLFLIFNILYAISEVPLIEATEKGDVEAVKKLLKQKIDINEQDRKGYTALMKASKLGYDEIARILIQAGADVNTTDYVGFGLLIFSKKNGHTEIVRMLIQAGADVNAKTKLGTSPIIKASDSGNREILHMLIQAMADLNVENMWGCPPLMVSITKDVGYPARIERKKSIAKLLIKAGADIDAKNNNGETAIIKAINNKYEEIVELLRKPVQIMKMP